MSFFYATLGALAILAGFLFAVGRQNRDLLRARAYGEFLVRLLPLLTAGVLILGLPFVMNLTIEGNALLVLLVYLGGAYYNRASALAPLGGLSGAREDLQTIPMIDPNRRLRRAAEEALKTLN